MSNMKKFGERGEMNILLIPFILVLLFFFGTGGFAYWAYTNMVNYRDHADQMIAAAVKVANANLTQQLQAQFAEEAKNPYKTYVGPSAFGSVHVVYPKTWSAYIPVDSSSDTPIDGYFYPDVVPQASSASSNGTGGTNFALRVQVLQQNYSDVLQNFQSQVQSGTVIVHPFHLDKVPGVIGVEVTGQIEAQKTGTLIILPLRNQTLQIFTEGNQFQADFTKIILPNFSFSP